MTDPSTAFGFSFESEDEIQSIAKRISEHAQTQIQEISAVVNTKSAQLLTLDERLKKAESRITQIIDLINPFLVNLAAEPEKIYIKWPDRASKIAEFQERLQTIIKE